MSTYSPMAQYFASRRLATVNNTASSKGRPGAPARSSAEMEADKLAHMAKDDRDRAVDKLKKASKKGSAALIFYRAVMSLLESKLHP